MFFNNQVNLNQQRPVTGHIAQLFSGLFTFNSNAQATVHSENISNTSATNIKFSANTFTIYARNLALNAKA